MASTTVQTSSRRCSYCRENGHNIRSCEKRKESKSNESDSSRVKELVYEIEEEKKHALRTRQLIGALLSRQFYLETKNSLLLNEMYHLEKQLEEEKEKHNNTFAVNTMKELLVKSNECCDICFEKFELDKIVIRPCWHKCCSSCNERLNKCHVCRS
jgi:hypothetical protein